MILSFHPCFETADHIILGDRRIDSEIIALMNRAEAIILPQGCPEELYSACSKTRALKFPNYEKRFGYPGKIGQTRLFELYGFLHPETFCWSSVKSFEENFSKLRVPPHSWPFLLKEDRSHEAEGVYLVDSENSLEKALRHIAIKEKSVPNGFVSQAYIDSGGNVLRTVIMGRDVTTYWKRPIMRDQKITTISRGAIIDHDWKPLEQKKGRIQTLSLVEKTGINLAAIDFVFDESTDNPDPFFLEINYFFGRRGMGGTERYYLMLYSAIQDWLQENGLNPKSVNII